MNILPTETGINQTSANKNRSILLLQKQNPKGNWNLKAIPA
jgi:hypothetical protein